MAANDDLRFVYEQARRFVTARPWERLGNASLYLDLKVGSRQDACAQHFNNGSRSVLLLFPGHRNMLDLERGGLAEPPAGTIFVELVDDDAPPDIIAAALEHGWPAELRPIPAFQVITRDGWLPLERSQFRLLALALAAIVDFDGAGDIGPDAEVAGELTLLEATRGRYRARRAPHNDDRMVPKLMLWRRQTRLSGGEHAVVVEDTDAGQQPADPNGASVHAIFECRSQGS